MICGTVGGSSGKRGWGKGGDVLEVTSCEKIWLGHWRRNCSMNNHPMLFHVGLTNGWQTLGYSSYKHTMYAQKKESNTFVNNYAIISSDTIIKFDCVFH